MRLHKAQGQSEASLESSERRRHLVPDLGFERELLIQRRAVLLRELSRDRLLARQRLAQLGFPECDLVLLRVGLADRGARLFLGVCQDVDKGLPFGRAPDAELGRADELEVRRLQVVLELSEEDRNGLLGKHESHGRRRREGGVGEGLAL